MLSPINQEYKHGLRRNYLENNDIYANDFIMEGNKNSCSGASSMNSKKLSVLECSEDYLPCGYPRNAGSSSQQDRLTEPELVSKWKKKNTNPFDMNSPARGELSVFTEETDTVFADDERNSGFLVPLRHQGHYFSNLDFFTSSGYNYLKYAKYSELSKSNRTNSPHLSISHLSFSMDTRTRIDRWLWRVPKIIHSLNNISMELVSGDIMALLYTTEQEVKTLLRIIAGDTIPNGKISGEFMINGHRIKSHNLKGRIAFIREDDLPEYLTVYQYLQLYTSYYGTEAANNCKSFNMIDQLVVTLALTHFKNVLCSELTKSEKRRVQIACQILCDTDILVCDNITGDMDVYDSAFVIDFLRDWALKLNRIVIMSIAPCSMGVLEMFSQVSILASGQLIYFGTPSNFIPYFESINFPCPPFKNPCDYYVDLATHDHLTVEASKDSSQRIDILCSKWKQHGMTHVPVTISTLPNKLENVDIVTSSIILYKRYCKEMFNKPLLHLQPCICTLFISLIIGFIFFQLSNQKRSEIDDRLGLITTIMYFILFPLCILWIKQAHIFRKKARIDARSGFYSSITYSIVTISFLLPLFITQILFFVTPLYLLSGITMLNGTDYSFISFFLIIFLYFGLVYSICFFLSHFLKSPIASLVITYLFISIFHLSSGLSVVSADFPASLTAFRLFSPGYWTSYFLLHQAFLGSSVVSSLIQNTAAVNFTEIVFSCERKKILAKRIDEVPIYTISTCSKFRSDHLMAFYGFEGRFLYENYSATHFVSFGIIVIIIWIAIFSIFFCCSNRKKSKIK